MALLNDLTGKTFGNWLVLYRNGSTQNKAAIWKCKCMVCGAERDVVGYSLTQGKSTMCRACVPRQTLSLPHRKERIYNSYNGMMGRCYNKNNVRYDRYGGRGIKVCDEWRNNPDAFIDWALASGYKDGLTIERIDVNGDYCPSNCCWIPQAEQAKTRATNCYVEYCGDVLCLAEACRRSGVSYEAVLSRRRRRMISVQEAFDHYASV